MNVDSFLEHHGITQNPFEAEEARHDPVFERLVSRTQRTHPEFLKILGNIDRPHTSVVFGEKGAGKTAIRLLIAKRVAQHNAQHADRRTLLVAYDDLNPVLDVLGRNRDRVPSRDPDGVLKLFRIEDHQDAILSLAVTKLADALVGVAGQREAMQIDRLDERLRSMPRTLRVDAAVLAALYDQPRSGGGAPRWRALRSRLKLGWRLPFSPLKWAALLLTVVAVGFFVAPYAAGVIEALERLPGWVMPAGGVAAAAAALLWIVWLWRRVRHWRLCRKIKRETPALDRTLANLRRRLWDLRPRDRGEQPWPLPGGDGTHARYELTNKLLRVLSAFGYAGVIVLVDRVDEPTLVAGQPERMRKLVWPMFDSKFLQQDGLGLKLLLPIELRYLVHRETSEFFQEARLDKQSLVDRLEWSGATLYDLCTDRLRACHREEGAVIALTDLFDEDVSRDTLVEALGQMHQPRDAFKLLYSVIQEHCSLVPEEDARYRIPRLTLDGVRRRQAQRVNELHRGLSPA